MNHLTSAIFKALESLIVCIVILMCVIVLTGCDEQSQYTYQEPLWYRNAPIEYRFPNAYQCMLRIHGASYNIPKYQKKGVMGELKWEWDSNGNIHIKYLSHEYNLHNPYNYKKVDGDFVMVWVGDRLVKRK